MLAADQPEAAQETEAFFVFTRGQRHRPERPARPDGKQTDGKRPARRREEARDKPSHEPDGRKGKPRHGDGPRKPKPGPQREDKPAVQARPPRQEKPIDPDNPFAALMALKLRS